jgi:hypothetical protein
MAVHHVRVILTEGAQMPTANCALCLQAAELQKSHLIPQGIYRAIQEPGQAIRNPVLVTAATTVETSEQVSDYLLCKGCETRFQQCGEDWVMKNGPRRNGRFPLREALMRSSTGRTITTGELYTAPFDGGFDLSKLIYFAASVFWRSSAHHWNGFEHLMTRAKLPVRLEEELRRFLLGERGFPRDLVLLLSITAHAPLPHFTHPGPMTRAGGVSAEVAGFAFMIPGIQFRMFHVFPDQMRGGSAAIAPHPVLLTDRMQNEIHARSASMREASKVVGALAKKTGGPGPSEISRPR